MSRATPSVAESTTLSDASPTRSEHLSELNEDRLRHIVFKGQVSAPAGRRSAVAGGLGLLATVNAKVRAEAEVLDRDLAHFYRRLFDLNDLDVGRYRTAVLVRREAACLRALKAAGLGDAEGQLIADPAAVRKAIDAVLIGVTSFFRDPHAFSALNRPLRELARQRGSLRVLSVGCSDGPELYSIAILFKELGLAAGELVGVDCRDQAIDKARAGIYPAEAIRELPTHLIGRYFDPVRCNGPAMFRLTPELRAACQWVRSDAFELPQTGTADLLLCRNLFIYLTAESAANLWRLLASRVSPGGLMLVGKAERPMMDVGLRRIGPCLYRKRETP